MIKILIAAKETELLRSLREYLKLKEFQVAESENGEGLLQIWQEERPDLLVLDLDLEAGMETLRRIRKSSHQLPILTLAASQEAELQAFEEEADDCMVKPISMEILLKRIQALLRRSQVALQEKMELGGWQMDYGAYQASWKRQPVELTSKEFELLWGLMQRRGRVLTRSQLLDEIWGYDYIGDERIVDAHIKNLRHKLPVNLIRTVKGRGYMFNEEECEVCE